MSEDTAARIQRILREESGRFLAPGAACGVILDGASHVAAVGVTSVKHPRPIDDRTLFQVGSISKTLTALAVMQLVEDGRLALEDRVAQHLPDVVDDCALDDRTTVEHLLSHQAGFDGDILLVSGEASLTAIRRARRLFDPGTGFSYSNASFSIAGALVAKLAGAPFDAAVRDRILEPLGMRRSCFTADRAIHESVALPHWIRPGKEPVVLRSGWQPGWELSPNDWAPAGLVSSLREQLMWCRFNLGDGHAPDGTSLVSPAGLARLHAPVARQDAAITVGLDWFRWTVDGAEVIGHLGLTAGYCTDLVLLPERGFALVTLVNATTGAGVFREVRRRVLGELLGLDDRDPVPLRPPPDASTLAACEGTFHHSFGQIVVASAGPDHPGELVTTHLPRPEGEVRWQPRPPPTQRVAFWAPDELVVVHPRSFAGMTQSIGRASDGSVSHLLWNGRRAPRA